VKQKWILMVLVVVLCGLLAGCQTADTQGADETPVSSPTGGAELPNPAAAYCEEQGHKYEIRTASDGSQSGVCIFADGSECDEWAYYRGECGPGNGGQ
jgi:putative hemolysin